MTIGEKIRSRREERGITQVELSKTLEISQPMLAQIERGTKVPSMPLGKRIAEVLECKLEELF